jgi:hypothetical protein
VVRQSETVSAGVIQYGVALADAAGTLAVNPNGLHHQLRDELLDH